MGWRRASANEGWCLMSIIVECCCGSVTLEFAIKAPLAIAHCCCDYCFKRASIAGAIGKNKKLRVLTKAQLSEAVKLRHEPIKIFYLPDYFKILLKSSQKIDPSEVAKAFRCFTIRQNSTKSPTACLQTTCCGTNMALSNKFYGGKVIGIPDRQGVRFSNDRSPLYQLGVSFSGDGAQFEKSNPDSGLFIEKLALFLRKNSLELNVKPLRHKSLLEFKGDARKNLEKWRAMKSMDIRTDNRKNSSGWTNFSELLKNSLRDEITVIKGSELYDSLVSGGFRAGRKL